METMTFTQSEDKPLNIRNGFRLISSFGVILICMSLVVTFLYFDRHGALSVPLRSWGIWGVILAVLLMALLSVIPIPAEFLLVLNMKVYGVPYGIFYAWIGTMIGTLTTFVIARYLGAPLVKHWVSEQNWTKVEMWVKRRGARGLLLARLLPIPAPIVNYAAGLMKSISLWNYLWTAAVSIWPYYIGAASLFVGIPNRFAPWIALGVALLFSLWIMSYFLSKKTSKKDS